jgi:hypothetical protein
VLGADAAVDYRDASFGPRLTEAAAAAGCVDVFFDNVGGSQLTRALEVMNNYGTVVLCGTVSSYADPDAPGAGSDLHNAVFKRIALRGYIVSDHYPTRLHTARADLSALLHDGRLKAVVSEFDGLDRAPEALASVFERGSPHIGRRVVRIARTSQPEPRSPVPGTKARLGRVKFAIDVAPLDELADPRLLAELAATAEDRGWDGFFVWDHIVYRAPVQAVLDPWSPRPRSPARPAGKIGTMITPLSRRRVHKPPGRPSP